MIKLKAIKAGRADLVIAQAVPELSRSAIARAADQDGLRVNGQPRKGSFKVFPGDQIEFFPVERDSPDHLQPAAIPIDVLFEDEWLIVVNKPRGLITHPAPSVRGPTLVNALLGRDTSLSKQAGSFRPGIVHRLDKDTTGLLMIAKSDQVHQTLARQIESKLAQRRYFAWVSGLVTPREFKVNAPIGRHPTNRTRMAIRSEGKSSETRVVVVRTEADRSLLAVGLTTGRTHQIRVHLEAIGHPVLGDSVYGQSESELPMQLHAALLCFEHPIHKSSYCCYAACPDDFIEGRSIAAESILLVDSFGATIAVQTDDWIGKASS